ncbi:tRNA (adenosine(37)-N6)-threonylcarbamoyltransferase complex dimerization subunit type 1 TsaB [Kordia sp. YSTF-M3]|uniref:tRNA (Adenosine(37)-N6)-threonylcarbamoyltransferase complex dimerization subunit type 1 TsaB n=1 Tax=Kordia aestuariivivens TaxID=2759037 RepID=A0ABR7Q3G9_9FLAO|nr:tRNA (adenosine(37)-N6)-threonylcarbamoyltransferase complex dimerization subunit type 1 TsaB [Kordia aestuariivivens]MBC8753102.1 tRNA (adenosine(37)-N6)-threonylcarbamoyltransferase complex dimerization subunit type 1 TsaB [Kordia aestuariivivens]
MAIRLYIETATTNCSVCLADDDEILYFKEENDKNYSHAEKLHVFIKEAYETAQIKPAAVSAIIVGKGPGSYTGLRIGVSTAKGLCFASDIALVAIESLEILARSINVNDGIILSLLDARRMEVYSAVFNSNHEQIRETKAEIITEDSFSDYLAKGKVHFIGNGAEKCKGVITHENAVFYDEIYFPSTKHMIAIGMDKHKKNDTEDVAYFEPYYLKDFVVTKPKKK